MIGLYLRACRRLGPRVVLERLRRLAFVLNDKFGCESCGATWPAMFPFMVENGLWEGVVGDVDSHLCLNCFESKMKIKIGRGLLASDFSDVPINNAIFAGIRAARRKE